MMPSFTAASGTVRARSAFLRIKALIPDIRRTREQLHIKRMLENNNEVLLSMISKEMSFLLDAKNVRRRRNSENWTSSSVSSNPFGSLRGNRPSGKTEEIILACLGWQTSCIRQAKPD